jgi:hypothetical protein
VRRRWAAATAAFLSAASWATAVEVGAPQPRVAVALGGVRPETSALLLAGGEGGDLRLAAVALPQLPAKAGKVDVALTVELDGSALLAGVADGPLGVELAGYALDAKGAVLDFFSEGVRLELPADAAALAASGLRYRGRVSVPPGPVSIRVLARSRRNGAFGVCRTDLQVPATLAPATLPLAPQWPGGEAPWLAVDSPRGAGEAPSAALPVLAPGSVSRFQFRAPRGGGLAGWRARLVAEGGGSPKETPLVEVERRSDAVSDLVTLEMPALGLSLGAYRVTVVAVGANGREVESPAARVLSPGERATTLWPALAAARADRLVALPPAGTPALEKQDLEEYRRALARLATGDRSGALGAVAAFELRVLANRDTFEALQAIEHQVIAELDRREPEALPPAALLHYELVRRYLGEGRAGFPRHALDTALWIAEAYGAHGAESAARAVQIVVSLAGSAIDAGAPTRASVLFARAAALDPASEIARLGRAAVETRLGNLQAARGELLELLARQPAHREARLRKALLEARAGDRSGAERALRELAAPEAPADWITALAYQELARGMADGRRAPEALALLRVAMTRLPGEPGVTIEYAYACERAGERGPALEALASLATRPAAGESARHRYSRWPDEELRSARRAFQQDAMLRLPRLQSALASPPRNPK